MRASFAVCLAACAVLSVLPVGDAWLCNVTLTGSSSAPQPLQFSEASVRCNATTAFERVQTLRVGIDTSLSSATFEGLRPSVLPAISNDTLLYFDSPNITFQHIQLGNVDAWYLDSILIFNSTHSYISQLVSTGCTTNYSVVGIVNAPGQKGRLNETFTIQNASFANITGQALQIDSSNVNISASSFTNLSAQAVWAEDSNVTIVGGHFSNSTQAIVIHDSYTEIENTVFDRLGGYDTSGGAISVTNGDGSSVSMTNCTFTNNWATAEIDGDLGYGGAFCALTGPHVNFEDCLFENNTATNNGGAIKVWSQELEDNTWAVYEGVNILNCTFRNNTATSVNGGAIHYDGSNGLNVNQETLYISNSTFFGNNASSGGALCAWGVALTQMEGCVFGHNTAYYGRGGGLYAYGQIQRVSMVMIYNTSFTANNATNTEDTAPGGIFDVGECAGAHISSCSCVGILDSTFDDNLGIGLCLRDVSGGCEPDDNETSLYPPLFERQAIAGPETVPMINDALGLDISIKIALDIRTSQFRRNTAASLLRLYDEPTQPADSLAGGAALDIIAAPYAVLADNDFRDNYGRQGSAVHLDSCQATIIWNSTFQNNTATHEGGAVATVNSHGNGLLVGASSLQDNLALSGGALYGDSGASIKVTNGSLLYNNTAVTNGGAIDCEGCQLMTMQYSSFATANTAQEYGGACFCDGCTQVQLHQSYLTNNSAGNGGALFVSGTSATSVTLVNITSAFMTANSAAKAASAVGTTGSGGAMYILGGVTTVANTNFTGNAAANYGGGVVYAHDCFNLSSLPGDAPSAAFLWEAISPQTKQLAAAAGNCSAVHFTANYFGNNYASVGGGAMYATDFQTLDVMCAPNVPALGDLMEGCPTWRNNTVQSTTVVNADGTTTLQGYGGAFAFPPNKTLLDGPLVIQNYVSNGLSKLPMTIHVQDQAGTLITSELSSESPLRATVGVTSLLPLLPGMQGPLLQGQNQASAFPNGTISINDLSLIAVPGNYNVSVTLPDFDQVPAASLMVKVRPCAPGEVQQTPQTCSACAMSTYSFNSSASFCDSCPPNANCSGGSNLIPTKQFWHSAANSDFIVPCPNNNACNGDRNALLACKNATYVAQSGQTPNGTACNLTAPMDSTDANAYMVKQCSPGYYGPVCTLCNRHAADGKRYGRTGITSCKPCRSSGTIVFAYIASTCLVLLWLFYTIQVTLQENREDAAGVVDPGRTSELIRALTLWLQYMTLLGNVNISAPAPLHWVFSAASFAFSTVTSGSLSIDCLQSGETNPAVQRIIFYLFLPLVVLAILVLMQTIWWWIRPGNHVNLAALPTGPPANPTHNQTPVAPIKKREDLRQRLMITLLTTVFYYYPSLLTTALSLFQCYHIDPQSAQQGQHYFSNARATWRWGYWVPDMSIQCFDSWHLGFSLGLGIPLLGLVVVGIPFLPIFLLYRFRHRLFTTSVKLRLGFIYHSYRTRFWFWDSIVLIQTLALAASQVFATSLNSYFQLTIMLMVLVIGITVLAHYQPFEDALSQSMQVFGLFVVVATATGCLYFLDQGDIAATAGLNAAGVLLLILNAAFVLVMAVLIIKRGTPYVRSWLVYFQQSLSEFYHRLRGGKYQQWLSSSSRRSTTSTVSSSGSIGRQTSVQMNLLSNVFTRSGTLNPTASGGNPSPPRT